MKRLSVAAAVVLMLMMMLPRGGSALEVSISPLASCEPDCTGMATGDKVVDPKNCTNYYFCFNGQPAPHPNSCGNTSHFDPATLECVAGTDCEPVCGGGGSGCAITCNATTTVVANLFDCSTYYFCTPGGPVLAECSADFPYFDGSSCTYDESVCCSPYCDVNCDGSALAIVPDPKDCGSFYVCEEGVEGDPGEEFKYSCGAGKYFNIALGNCEAGDPNSCTTLCDAATGGENGDSSSTSTTTTTTTTTSSGGGGGSSSGPTSGGGSSSGPTSGGGTTTTTTTGDCVTTFTCPAAGDFPACQTCQPEYFDCAGAGVPGVMTTCPGDNVFNPTPGFGFCALPGNCPYP
ncbi:spore coat protein SP70-like [Eriocheir sinensis]|uniref:spore coat protein SP70-like n=1 Tax=Eriocheir sinensis TaxID=95602 RepID=UPI0021C79265|nr:spore coat protein SP70-like [Eriocheir sinensis]